MGKKRMPDQRVLIDRDEKSGIARLSFNDPDRKNSYDAAMRNQMAEYLDELAYDDAIKVVLIRGEGGVFSSGADMNNAYSWYGDPSGNGKPQAGGRPSQRRRLSVDRKSFSFYHNLMGYPKAVVAEVRGCALGGGFEIALMADIAVVGNNALLGMPATRFLGPALGSLQLFFYRLGPVMARRMLLTGDTIKAGDLPDSSVFTEIADDSVVSDRAEWWAQKISRMPADGIVIAKEAFRLIEQLHAYAGEEVISPLMHAFATNLQFDDEDFNFVKTRKEHGTKNAFEMSRVHFNPPQNDSTGGD
jgi:enoyl-CoA hydratase